MSFLSEPITLKFLRGVQRKIGSINVNVVLTETTNDTLTITKQPVQQGASITDHAYKEPTVFSMQILFRDNLALSLSKIYEQLLALQVDRVPFEVVTPKRVYKNMLLGVLTQTTDKSTENCLAISVSFQEVIIVKVSTTQVPRQKQKAPATTGATENAGKKSALQSLREGIGL